MLLEVEPKVPAGEADLVRILDRAAVALLAELVRELYECCRLMDGGVTVACVSGERLRFGDWYAMSGFQW